MNLNIIHEFKKWFVNLKRYEFKNISYFRNSLRIQKVHELKVFVNFKKNHELKK